MKDFLNIWARHQCKKMDEYAPFILFNTIINLWVLRPFEEQALDIPIKFCPFCGKELK